MKKTEKENDSPGSSDLLKRVRISYLLTSSLVIVFAVSYGYLEYYYINDPVLGKTDKEWDSSCCYSDNRRTLFLSHILITMS